MSSSNHKFSVPNGNGFSSHKPKKAKELWHGRTDGWSWKMVLILLWLLVVFSVFLWVLVNFKNGKLCRRTQYHTNEDNMHVLRDDCHVSKEMAASSLCCRVFEYQLPPGCTAICDLQKPISDNQLFKQDELVRESIQFSRQCPYGEERNTNHLGVSLSEDMSASFIPCSTFTSISSVDLCYRELNNLQREDLYSCAKDHCESILLRVAKICLWILMGMALSYYLLWVHDKIWSHNHQMIQQQPLSQQTQLQQQAQFSTRSTGKWRMKLLIVFVIAGVVISIWLFWYLNEDIMFRRKETLASMCDERARMLQDQFNVSMNHVHALAILISTFHHEKQPSAIDQKTFEDYTERTAFERPLTSGVAYALRVRHSERELIEQQFGWTIKKMETEDQTLAHDYNPENFCTSPIQDEYAPVIFSQKTVSHIVSIDMMSGKEDRENILRARASGKGVLTSPFKLLKSNHLGVVLTFAVYNTDLPPHATPEQRINATVGYLGASYDVPSLVEKLLHQLASKQTVIVNVYDTTSKNAPIKMYGPDVEDTGLLYISYLDFGDPTRKHEMHCRFKQRPPPPWQAIAASLGVLVITVLLGHIFHAAINQIAKVEHDYRVMEELKRHAEAADVAKSQFLATVSHEIRTPMNGVLGMLQMLMDTNLDDSQKDYAETAHSSGRDLISLINKVLDQAKINSGRLELEAVPFDLRSILDKVVSIFSCEKGIELAVYVSDQVPQVVIGDQERFGQIITNLVGNSIKFTHNKGHIFVTVHLADEVRLPLDVKDEVLRESSNVVQDSLNASYNTLSGFQVVDRWKSWEKFSNLGETAEEPGKIRLLVTVEDTGAGIPPEAQERIFTPFMQADSSTSRKYGGTGIGLSISKRLVDLMGGEIGFVSELDVGSTFSFTVPVTKAVANSLDPMWQQCDTAPVSVFRGLRALVIDEKRIRAAVTRYHLQRLGMSVEITSSMESACSYLSCNSKTSVSGSDYFSVVLIEQEYLVKETCIPFHNLIKMLKHDCSRSKLGISLKVFLLSTSISSADRNKLKSEGVLDDVITKPLRMSSLISVFQEATGKRNETKIKPSNLRSLLKGKQILVVDDNGINRRVAEGALKKYGAVVTCADGGKPAVELLKPPHKFDACFMDLQMPEMDGFEATRQIRRLESKYNLESISGDNSAGDMARKSNWHTPILAMTADVIQGTNEECMKCGMDDYVSKPFGEGQLYSAVARFFEAG